jgi:hypothetical protein
MAQLTTWEKLANELKDYGGKIDNAKAQFDDLSINIDDFTNPLEEAAAREKKITQMLHDFMIKIDNVSQQTWEPTASQRSERSHQSQVASPLKLLATPTPYSPSSASLSSPSQSAPPAPTASTSTFLSASDLVDNGNRSNRAYTSSNQLGSDGQLGPQVHISRHGSVSIMGAK